MSLDIYVVNAFVTDKPFSGNPAAVVPLEEWLPDATMQAIAAQNNLSETAFFVPRQDDDGYDLRWFTPTVEVDLCGHATLAAASVILDDMAIGMMAVRFNTRSGWLGVLRTDDGFALDFPVRPAVAAEPPAGLLDALGGGPAVEVLQASSWLVVYPDVATVQALKPDMARLIALDAAVIATAPGGEGDFASRFFVPTHGIPEDPVTGSVHCTLAPYWAARLGKTTLDARQVSARGGKLALELKGERVAIAGEVKRYLDGRIFLH
jgi:predicted PhzF superfamily epimerase YddE/YHI9